MTNGTRLLSLSTFKMITNGCKNMKMAYVHHHFKVHLAAVWHLRV